MNKKEKMIREKFAVCMTCLPIRQIYWEIDILIEEGLLPLHQSQIKHPDNWLSFKDYPIEIQEYLREMFEENIEKRLAEAEPSDNVIWIHQDAWFTILVSKANEEDPNVEIYFHPVWDSTGI